MLPNKLTPILLSVLLFGCSADSKPLAEQPKNNVEKQPTYKPKTIVTILKFTPSKDGTYAGMVANLIGKLVIIDNCLLIESGDPNAPHYHQLILFDNEYAWNEQKKVLIHKYENNKEYPIGSEIMIGGGALNEVADNEFRKDLNIPKCSVPTTLWHTH